MVRLMKSQGLIGVCLTAAALALPLTYSAPSADAATPLVTCDGQQMSSISPGLTDTVRAQSGTAAFTEGADADLLGLFGSFTCQSADPTITGATMTQQFHTMASCNQSSEQASFTGTIDWDNGKTSTLTDGTFELTNRDNGDAVLTLTAHISAGEFADHTLTAEVNSDTADPAACATTGITATAGEDAMIIS